MRHFNSPSAGQIVIRVELLLQLECLVAGVCLSAASPQTICAYWTEINKILVSHVYMIIGIFFANFTSDHLSIDY